MDPWQTEEQTDGPTEIPYSIASQYAEQASKFIRQKQYYDNITKYKQYNGRLPEGNPSIELVAYSKI